MNLHSGKSAATKALTGLEKTNGTQVIYSALSRLPVKTLKHKLHLLSFHLRLNAVKCSKSNATINERMRGDEKVMFSKGKITYGFVKNIKKDITKRRYDGTRIMFNASRDSSSILQNKVK